MAKFEFTIVASGLDHESDDFADIFYEAGCTDATVSFQRGMILVDFSREGATPSDALAKAVAEVHSTGATIHRIEPDPLVTISDIAERSGLSRAATSLYARGERGAGFPRPAARVLSDSPLYKWADVAEWLFQREQIGKATALEASLIREANALLGEPKYSERMSHRLGYSETHWMQATARSEARSAGEPTPRISRVLRRNQSRSD